MTAAPAWRRFRPDRLYTRVVVPALIAVLFLEWLFWWLGVREPDVHLPGGLILNMTLAWYAVVRARRNVPYTFSGYRAWLATTPWTVDRPLPFGPIELDWPDAVILGAFIAVNGAFPDHQSARLLALFFFLHCLALVPTIRGAANHVPAYAALFGLGLMLKLWHLPWACATTGVVVYLIVYDGLRLTLARFPEPGDEKTVNDLANFDPAKAECGWPYERLLREPAGAPEGERPPAMSASEIAALSLERIPMHGRVRLVDAMAWGLLAGWWAACVGPIFFAGDRFRTLLGVGVPALAAISGLVRLTIYTNSYLPPMTMWGRFRTLRWIIPGYDVVFVGPALTVMVPTAMLLVGVWRDFPLEAVGPTAIAATLFIALAAPPSLRRWRLVGRHRMVPGQPGSSQAGEP
ncbi:hypothetical protein [Paludisphaera sp.]|uniref:hypothetical protein n=1 Tax=Paludisphaera sp. TaxID=2017432 RepID=UPI00301BD77E